MVANPKTSLYCWMVLLIFIVVTLIFMVNFYNRAVDEIINNYQGNQLITTYNLENYVQQ